MRTAIDSEQKYRLHLHLCDWHQAAVTQHDCVEAVASLLDISRDAAVDVLNQERSVRGVLNRFGVEVYQTEFVADEPKPENNLLGTLFGVGMFALAAVALVLGCVEVFGG